jgi:DNA-binding beta-propeller fold protein YncE
VNQAPVGPTPYEIWLYSKIGENNVRKTFVFHYYPNAGSEQGFVYLPEKGPVWELNIGTIYLPDLNGKWSYAAPAWEALIKPVIARAEDRSNSSSTAEDSKLELAESAKKRADSNDVWTKPQPGWLYVLDPRSESDHPGSRVWLLDPETAKMMGGIHAGIDPDFALSPDGSRLYIASGERESGELAVVETATGNVKRFPFPARILYKPWYQDLPPFSRMNVSSDGRALRILTHHLFSPEKIGYQLWTFDTANERFSHSHVALGNCGYGEFVPSASASHFYFLCPTTDRVRSIELDADNHVVSNTFVRLPWQRGCGTAAGFISPDQNRLEIVRSDGAIYEMNTVTQEFGSTSQTADCQQLVFSFEWPRSRDGARVYLGYGPMANYQGMATSGEIRVFDTTTWRQIGELSTSLPFWSASLSNDDRFLYAVAPQQHRVLVIDATALRETRAIDIGRTPALVLVAP